MCLITKSKYGCISKRDMTVYKYFILDITNVPGEAKYDSRLETPCRNVSVPCHVPFIMESSIQGRVRLSDMGLLGRKRYDCSGEGVHAYTEKNIEKSFLSIFIDHNKNNHITVQLQAECLIPKGTRIYRSALNLDSDPFSEKIYEIAAQKMEIKKFLPVGRLPPFYNYSNFSREDLYELRRDCINPILKQINGKEK